MNISPFKVIIFCFIAFICIVGLAIWAGILTKNSLEDLKEEPDHGQLIIDGETEE